MISLNRILENMAKASKTFFSFCKASIESRRHIPALKIIIQEQLEKNGDIYFIMQIAGKNLFPKLSAEEVFCDKQLFDSFSEEDRKRIAYAYKNKKLLPMECPPKSPAYLYKLFSVEPERESNKKIFKIELVKDGTLLLKRLSSEAIYMPIKKCLMILVSLMFIKLAFIRGKKAWT